MNILLAHHPYFLFWFHNGFHFSPVTHVSTLPKLRKDQGKGCLPSWHPRETRSCQQSWWARCWRRAGTRCCWRTPCGHAGCTCTSHCTRRKQECTTTQGNVNNRQLQVNEEHISFISPVTVWKNEHGAIPHPSTALWRQPQNPTHWCLLPSNKGWSRKVQRNEKWLLKDWILRSNNESTTLCSLGASSKTSLIQN